jgi:hypothetical protein
VRRPGWLTVALGGAAGFFIGVVLVVGLGDPAQEEPQARPIHTQPATPRVPDLVGQPLDVARDRLERAGYTLDVAAGGGLFGPVIEDSWQIADQQPRAGAPLGRGGVVQVAIERY